MFLPLKPTILLVRQVLTPLLLVQEPSSLAITSTVALAVTPSTPFTADSTILANISNVKTINLRANGNDVDVTLDMDSVTGATAVYADRLENVAAANDASVTVNNVVLGTTVGISGGALPLLLQAMSPSLSKVPGSSDSVSLDLKGGIVNALTVANIELSMLQLVLLP